MFADDLVKQGAARSSLVVMILTKLYQKNCINTRKVAYHGEKIIATKTLDFNCIYDDTHNVEIIRLCQYSFHLCTNTNNIAATYQH